MSEVFVVIGGWDYEGFDDPSSAFATREAAEAEADRLRADNDARYHFVKVFALTLDRG